MADLKISQLTGASTPLAGTEVLPIVQSGSTKKVSVADLTAGRAVASAGGTFSDNFVQGTAAKGVNFTANTALAGMTSQLLNWYEEGTWTPAITASTGSITSFTLGVCNYTRIGRVVHINFSVTITNAGTGAGALNVPLPFTNGAAIANGTGRENALTGSQLQARVNASGTDMNIQTYANTTAIATNAQIRASMTYFV